MKATENRRISDNPSTIRDNVMEFIDYLKYLAKNGASDLFLTTGAPPSAKIHGSLSPIDSKPLGLDRVKEIAYTIMTDEQKITFENELEMNLAISESGVGRFRVNIFKQRNQYSMVIRAIKPIVPNYKELDLPEILAQLVMKERGLVLFVGGTDSGKSSSLASLIDFRNENSADHIITIENPVEFIHKHKKSLVNQREVGMDTHSYEKALDNALRQSPDVILIDEVTNDKHMDYAITIAESGHLCLTTLHANNAVQALDRIINFYPETRQKQVCHDLATNIRAIVAQRLVHTKDGQRCAAIEVMINTPRICELVRHGKFSDIQWCPS
jgi:twitching motility protein PilU